MSNSCQPGGGLLLFCEDGETVKSVGNVMIFRDQTQVSAYVNKL